MLLNLLVSQYFTVCKSIYHDLDFVKELRFDMPRGIMSPAESDFKNKYMICSVMTGSKGLIVIQYSACQKLGDISCRKDCIRVMWSLS